MNTIDITKISKQLIAEARIDEAFNLFLNYSRSNRNLSNDIHQEILLLVSRYNTAKSNLIKGVVSNSESTLENSRILHSLLMILDKIDKDVSHEDKEVSIKNINNIVINDKVNVEGNFEIGNDVKTNDSIVAKHLKNQSKIKILFLASNPLNTNPLRLDKEMRDLEFELTKNSPNRDLFEVIKISAVRIRDLQDALLNYSPHFVHFSGHGNSDGIALLDSQNDNAKIIPSEPLGKLFKLFSNDIACVFLNSCYSKEQAVQIKKYIPNVIGMSKSVPDSLAIEFATVFYKGIGAGRDIGFSFELAKISIDLNNMSGSEIPTLI